MAGGRPDYEWIGGCLFSHRINDFVDGSKPQVWDGPEHTGWVESIRARERARREKAAK